MGNNTMEKLKAERVQDPVQERGGCLLPGPETAPAGPPRAKVNRLKAERVQVALRRLPRWKLTADRRAITRTFRFKAPSSPLAFAVLVSALAEEVDHFPQMIVNRDTVVLKLSTPAVRGLTAKDLKLAHRISFQA